MPPVVVPVPVPNEPKRLMGLKGVEVPVEPVVVRAQGFGSGEVLGVVEAVDVEVEGVVEVVVLVDVSVAKLDVIASSKGS